MNKIKRKFSLIISSCIYVGVFIFSLSVPADPDLGWHLKYGEFFFSHNGVLRDNTFSALMPNFHWNNSSWATDLLTYQFFHHFGFLGLSVLGAVVITATFFFIGRAAKFDLFEKSVIFPILLYFLMPVNQTSFRGQLISLLFISIMYYLLSIYGNTNKKIILLLLPLFVLWSNFHGEFILGAAIFTIWMLTFTFKELFLNYKIDIKRFVIENKFLVLTFLLAFPAVIINPFGLSVFSETFHHFNDPLQKDIAEWLSPTDFSTVWWHQLFIGTVITLGFAMLGLGKKTLDKAPFYVPSFILFVLTFGVRRYAWPFYYSSVFLLKPVVNFLKPDREKHTTIVSFVFAVSFLVIAVGVRYPFKNLTEMNWDIYCVKSTGCSSAAARFIVDKKLNNNKLLTIYDYGGWLIWNFPQIKPTIDGRMHLWRDENGVSAFGYYYPIEQNTTGDVNESPYNAVLTSHKKPIYNRLLQLGKEGKWREIYTDKAASVFVRNKEVIQSSTSL